MVSENAFCTEPEADPLFCWFHSLKRMKVEIFTDVDEYQVPQQMMTSCSSADPKKDVAQWSSCFRFDDVNRNSSDPSYTGANLRCDVSENVRVKVKLKLFLSAMKQASIEEGGLGA